MSKEPNTLRPKSFPVVELPGPLNEATIFENNKEVMNLWKEPKNTESCHITAIHMFLDEDENLLVRSMVDSKDVLLLGKIFKISEISSVKPLYTEVMKQAKASCEMLVHHTPLKSEIRGTIPFGKTVKETGLPVVAIVMVHYLQRDKGAMAALKKQWSLLEFKWVSHAKLDNNEKLKDIDLYRLYVRPYMRLLV